MGERAHQLRLRRRLRRYSRACLLHWCEVWETDWRSLPRGRESMRILSERVCRPAAAASNRRPLAEPLAPGLLHERRAVPEVARPRARIAGVHALLV